MWSSNAIGFAFKAPHLGMLPVFVQASGQVFLFLSKQSKISLARKVDTEQIQRFVLFFSEKFNGSSSWVDQIEAFIRFVYNRRAGGIKKTYTMTRLG